MLVQWLNYTSNIRALSCQSDVDVYGKNLFDLENWKYRWQNVCKKMKYTWMKPG